MEAILDCDENWFSLMKSLCSTFAINSFVQCVALPNSATLCSLLAYAMLDSKKRRCIA